MNKRLHFTNGQISTVEKMCSNLLMQTQTKESDQSAH